MAADQVERAEKRKFEKKGFQRLQPNPHLPNVAGDSGRTDIKTLLERQNTISKEETQKNSTEKLIRGWDFDKQTFRYYSELEVMIMRKAASYHSSGNYLYTPWYYSSSQKRLGKNLERKIEEYIEEHIEEILDKYGD